MSKRVDLKKGKVGVNSLGGYEKISALIGYFGTTLGNDENLELDTPIEFSTVNELETFGITQTSKPLLYRHISEFFRMGGRGTRLHVLSVTQPANAEFKDLIEAGAVKKLIASADGSIFNLGFSFVPTGVPTYVDGLHDGIVPAIKSAQVLADWCRGTNRPLHIVLEGAMYKGSATSALNLREMKESSTQIECPQVSLMIGQDYTFADGLTGNEQQYADIGALLGCMAIQPVSYNVGEVETMSLTNATRDLWITAGLSSHEKVKDLEEDLEVLNTKGYIFGEYYSGEVVLNDDHVCTPVIVDDEGNMNEHSIALSRTNAKVFREIYKVYLPKVKSTVPVDAATGKLSTGMIKYFENFGNRIFDNMAKIQELSGGETEVDPDSNLLYGDKELKVYYNWVPVGTISRIAGTVNIKRAL